MLVNKCFYDLAICRVFCSVYLDLSGEKSRTLLKTLSAEKMVQARRAIRNLAVRNIPRDNSPLPLSSKTNIRRPRFLKYDIEDLCFLISEAVNIISLEIELKIGMRDDRPVFHSRVANTLVSASSSLALHNLAALTMDNFPISMLSMLCNRLHTLRLTEELDGDSDILQFSGLSDTVPLRSTLFNLTELRCLQIRVSIQGPKRVMTFLQEVCSTLRHLEVLGLEISVMHMDQSAVDPAVGEGATYRVLVLNICDTLWSLQELRVLGLYIAPTAQIPFEERDRFFSDLMWCVHERYLHNCNYQRFELDEYVLQWDQFGHGNCRRVHMKDLMLRPWWLHKERRLPANLLDALAE